MATLEYELVNIIYLKDVFKIVTLDKKFDSELKIF